MSDMTREEAIKTLYSYRDCLFGTLREPIDMAINSLKVDEMYDLAMETHERLITRDDVVYAIETCGCLRQDGKTWYEEEELMECFDDLYFGKCGETK